MTEILEKVSFGLVKDIECPFSHEKAAEVKNDLSRGNIDTRLKNGLSTQLWIEKDGKIEPKEPESNSSLQEKKSDVCSDELPDGGKVTLAAHHIIPVKAVKKSSLLSYMEKKKGEIEGDIGYNVNGAENGIWLPCHTSGVPTLKADRPQNLQYADLAMLHANRQYHSGNHPNYSKHVTKRLNGIKVMLLKFSKDCPKCGKQKKYSPPHFLVFRLNNLSDRIRVRLKGSPRSWRRPLFTSPQAKDFTIRAKRFSL